jgi:hypothetical protein
MYRNPQNLIGGIRSSPVISNAVRNLSSLNRAGIGKISRCVRNDSEKVRNDTTSCIPNDKLEHLKRIGKKTGILGRPFIYTIVS